MCFEAFSVIVCRKIDGQKLGCPLHSNLDQTELKTATKVSLIVQYLLYNSPFRQKGVDTHYTKLPFFTLSIASHRID